MLKSKILSLGLAMALSAGLVGTPLSVAPAFAEVNVARVQDVLNTLKNNPTFIEAARNADNAKLTSMIYAACKNCDLPADRNLHIHGIRAKPQNETARLKPPKINVKCCPLNIDIGW